VIAVIDYGMGNLRSVINALTYLGADAQIAAVPEQLDAADRIILPGVGAFRDCIATLRRLGFVAALEARVCRRGNPMLGICLGLQVLARRSFEDGEHAGLGWLAADVVRLTPADPTLRVPQIGWNGVTPRSDSPLFRGIPAGSDFYFVHSYHLACDDPADLDAWCDYGGRITAAVRQGNVAATQFHPEKSQDFGLRVLDNFLRWDP
jgi:glutamine amidotransferase